ncbi:MAG: SBBP repeat-containing protein [Bryobacteraceae bacterium]
MTLRFCGMLLLGPAAVGAFDGARSTPQFSPTTDPTVVGGGFQVRVTEGGMRFHPARGGPSLDVQFAASGTSAVSPSGHSIRQRNVYPGIDFVLYRGAAGVEYDWEISPHSTPAAIRMVFPANVRLHIDADGDLVASRGQEVFRHKKPFIYQKTTQGCMRISGQWTLRQGTEAGFLVGPYDRSKKLIIDPVVVYSSGIGGTPSGAIVDRTQKMAVDREGSVYLAGFTETEDFPVTANAFQRVSGGRRDAFVAKFSKDGHRLEYSTRIGGSADESVTALAVDSLGNAYVAGVTMGDFPGGTPVSFPGRFICKVSVEGAHLEYCYMLAAQVSSIAVDEQGSLYFAGGSRQNLPITANAYQKERKGELDAFLGKLSPSGSLEYLTYFGGSQEDTIASIAIDRTGAVYVAGTTNSADLSATPGAIPRPSPLTCNESRCYDVFAAKFTPATSSLHYLTYLGGSDNDTASRIAVDEEGRAYIVGETNSLDFPVTPGAAEHDFQNVTTFVVRLAPDGTRAEYTTFLSGFDGFFREVTVDAEGKAYVAGDTTSFVIPQVDPIQPGRGERFNSPLPLCKTSPPSGQTTWCRDGLIRVLSPDGSSVVFSSFLGNEYQDSLVGIALTAEGDFIVAGDAPDSPPALPLPGSPRSSLFATRIRPAGQPMLIRKQWISSLALDTFCPGEAITLYGRNITNSEGILAAQPPLPLEIDGISVEIDGTKLPLLAVANVDGLEQINIVIPYDFPPPSSLLNPTFYPIVIQNRDRRTLPLWITPWPGVVLLYRQPDKTAMLHRPDGSLVSRGNPARRGEIVTAYATGMGSVDPPLPAGAAAPLDTPTRALIEFTIEVGGVRTAKIFAGLVPGVVALYQIQFAIPEPAPSGEVPLRLFHLANGGFDFSYGTFVQ